jgi:hypothetical protein
VLLTGGLGFFDSCQACKKSDLMQVESLSNEYYICAVWCLSPIQKQPHSRYLTGDERWHDFLLNSIARVITI